MNLKVISFGGKVFENDNAVSVNVMTKAGEITILEDHASLTTVVKPSVLEVEYLENGEKKVSDFAIGGGLLEVSDSEVKILADMLTSTDEVEQTSAEEAIKEAEELMAKYKDSKDKVDMEKFIEAEDMLLKSIAKLKLSELKK